MLRLVIVDDESPARASLRAALAALPLEVEVLAEAHSVASAVDVLRTTRPQVVLLDIWLGDGTGFDVLDQLPQQDLHVVFVTAYEQYAVQAFQRGALHYLLKPVVRADLQQALERAVQAPAPTSEALVQVRRALLDRITVPTAEGFHILDPAGILRCESDGNYTMLHLGSGVRVLAARTLKEFEALLGTHGFLRVHHSHMVNLAHVRLYLHRDGGVLVLSDGCEVPVAQRRRQDVLEALGRRPGGNS